MKKALDKNGKEIKIMDSVNVPEPNDTDIHIAEFQGSVADILDDGTIIVEDQDSDFFQIEANRLEIAEY